MTGYNADLVGQLAQLVEQRIENPRVRGSIPRLGTIYNEASQQCEAFLFSIARHTPGQVPTIHVASRLLTILRP